MAKNEDRALAKLSVARQAIAEAKKLGAIAPAGGVVKLREIKDQAEVVRAYSKKIGLNRDVQNDAAEIKIDCEREMGSLLARMGFGKHGGDRKSKPIVGLDDVGVERHESQRCLARRPNLVTVRLIEQALGVEKGTFFL